MIGIAIIILLSWLLIYLIEKKSLVVALGFLPIFKRLKQFLIGFFITAVLCILAQYFEAYLKSSNWILNDTITSGTILKSFWWDVKSVLTEELIFRGVLLYILIQKLGSNKAIVISALAFGVYHWFSYGVLGNILSMILVLIGTGLMGYAWAWAFSKTKSILLPFGLHLGWNFIYNTLFSKGPLGTLILVSEGGHDLSGWTSLLNFSIGLIVVPCIIIFYVWFFVRDSSKLRSSFD